MIQTSAASAVSKATALRLTGVQKAYDRGALAVQIEDLDVQAGEFVTLVGPSGCGKSTTMRMIAGLEEPTAGKILFNGQPVNDMT
ncbi:MAG: ABC transporter ATP-binding protein, partial [Hyphomicrobiales bacterium]|nr:ABC transporter ATP-binding protein [Hyphomicrobiales bacterium]